MISERELVGLLYRADWTKLTLSGTVSAPTEPAVDTRVTVRSDDPLSWPWQPEPGPPVPPWLSETEKEAWEARDGWTSRPSWYFLAGSKDVPCTLSVAPGRRFLAEHPDGAWAAGSDGERLWYWFRDRPAGKFAGFDDRPGPPYRSLLAPSWLLTGYSLVIDGEVTVAGRAGVRVRGTLRTAAARTPGIVGHLGAGGLSAPIPRWITADQGDEVEAVVDAELGILLRWSQRSADGRSEVTEFTSVDVAGTAGSSAFSPPPGSVFGGKGSGTRGPRDRPADGAGTSLGDALGEALGAAGKEAAKTVAGMAAGGLGALIRYAPRRQRADPFAQATAEAADPEAQMPADEPAPGGPDGGAAPALADEVLPDEVLHLLYRSGLTAAPFSAALHQWLDVGAALASIPRSARDRGFGGVGFLVDTVMRDLANEPGGANHEVSTVRMGGWNEYLINVVRPVADAASSRSGSSRSGHGDKHQLRAIASDGARQWQVFADRVLTGDAAPPPCDLADLVDASWLLYGSLDLSGGSEVWLAGRRAYRIVARYREETLLGTGWLERLFFPAVAVVDAETGLVLRLTRFRGGRPAARRELRDVTPLEPEASFGFTPPDGLPVRDAETPREQSPWERWARSTGRPD